MTRLNTILTVSVFMVATAGSLNARQRASGPGLSAPEQDEAVRKNVRTALWDIGKSMSAAKKAKSQWSLTRARLLARKAEADTALADCKEDHPDDWADACRLQIAECEAVDEETREQLIQAVVEYEERFAPVSRSIQKRVNELLTEPHSYRHLLVQGVRGGKQSRLLKLLLVTLDAVSAMRLRISEAVMAYHLADLLNALNGLEENAKMLDKASPELAEYIESFGSAERRGDPLAAHAYSEEVLR